MPVIRVVKEDDRNVGIITEADVIMAGEEADLHLPHYIELFGGMVFLESTRKFEERLRKAIAATARDVMTADPVTISPDAGGEARGPGDAPPGRARRRGGAPDPPPQAQPAAGRGARPAGRGRLAR